MNVELPETLVLIELIVYKSNGLAIELLLTLNLKREKSERND